jgi:hypothetical protein
MMLDDDDDEDGCCCCCCCFSISGTHLYTPKGRRMYSVVWSHSRLSFTLSNSKLYFSVPALPMGTLFTGALAM